MNSAALDRPVWSMLTGPQAHLARGGDLAVRIDPGYGPFAAAYDQSDAAQAALAALLRRAEDAIALVETAAWLPPPGTRVVSTWQLVQMVAETPAAIQPADPDCLLLGEADAAEMNALALGTEPGPWGELTWRYGQFFGLRRDGRMAAMAGERMRPAPGFAEVSAVCTWPEYRGQGLASALIRRVMAGFTARGDVPFLHSYAANTGAIGLYESLGFRVRRTMVLTVLARG
jgi:ribosomal protein S18 acetylase RimI-like enzyme